MVKSEAEGRKGRGFSERNFRIERSRRRERLGNGGAEESPGKKKQKTNKQTKNKQVG